MIKITEKFNYKVSKGKISRTLVKIPPTIRMNSIEKIKKLSNLTVLKLITDLLNPSFLANIMKSKKVLTLIR